VKALLEKGAEVNAVNKQGATALEYVRPESPEMMKLLITYGAKFSCSI
jgi:ankyrin repeat protein